MVPLTMSVCFTVPLNCLGNKAQKNTSIDLNECTRLWPSVLCVSLQKQDAFSVICIRGGTFSNKAFKLLCRVYIIRSAYDGNENKSFCVEV